jgi:hypothetical protein
VLVESMEGHSRPPGSVSFFLVFWRSTQSTVAGRARSGAAPHGLKDAFGAAARSASGSLTPGPLRPLPSGTAVRPVACPPQRPPRTRAKTGSTSTGIRVVGGRNPGRDFTRTDAPRQAHGAVAPARTTADRTARIGGGMWWWSP